MGTVLQKDPPLKVRVPGTVGCSACPLKGGNKPWILTSCL
jgi:hypothetical protein